jgi:O-antigen/teichoic acid export membrane protein
VEVSARVGGIGLGIALVATGHGVSGYLVGLAASSATIGAIGVFLSWPRAGAAARPEEEPPEGGAPATALRAWIAYGVPASFGATLLWGLSFVDRYLVALFKNAAAVGVYSMGSALGDRVVMVPMFAFAAASGPLLVTAFETKGRDEVERLLTEYSRVLLLVALPCAAFIAAVGPTLVTVIAGIHYALYGPAATVAPIVAIGSVLYGLSTLAMTGLAVSRQTRYLALSAGIGLATNVVANLALIPPFGINGAAIATPIGMGAYLLSVNYWAREHARWRVPWGTLVRALVAALAGYGALRIVPAPHNRVERILADAALGAAVYVLALAVLGERRRFAVRPV